MPIFHAIMYGLVQGLTEFLPVSSSAHLLLLPLFLGWSDPGLSFDVALHWGTLIAVGGYFWRDWLGLIRAGLRSLAGSRGPQEKLFWQVVAATVPGAILGYVFEKHAETVFRSPWILVGTMSFMGLLLWFADRSNRQATPLSELSWSKAILIGLCQGIAIVPGVSRSGITISVALLVGLNRTDAVRYSFFLSVPIIMGAGLLKLPYLLHNAGDLSIWVGLAAAAISGAAAIHVLLTYVKSRSFAPFVVYRLALAAGLAIWLLVH